MTEAPVGEVVGGVDISALTEEKRAELEGAIEALAEIEARVRHQFTIVPSRNGNEWRQVLPILLRDTRVRYQSADSQPAQDGERR